MVPQYLRISVTARCNLACLYCGEAAARLQGARSREFSPETIGFLARCAAAEGVRKVRLTGGEPLVRGDLEEIVREVGAGSGLGVTALTTNGIGLAGRAGALAAAGLSSANISLDTLRPDRFAALTGRDRLADVIAGIEAAAAALDTVKLNTVLMRGLNTDEIERLVRFAAARRLPIRFIERYGAAAAAREDDPDIDEIRTTLTTSFGALLPLPSQPLSIATSYRLPALGGAVVGLIASRSHPPCRTCAKLRFTADGQLRGCLFESGGADIADALNDRDEAAVRAAIRRVFAGKKRAGREKPWVGSPVRFIGG